MKKAISLVNFKLSNKVKNKDKRANQKIHFQRRFLERVGYILTEENYQKLKNLTRQSGVFLHTAQQGSAYRVKYNNLPLVVIYNVFEDSLITILS